LENKGYLSFGMYQVTSDVYAKDIAILALDGNRVTRKSFNLGDLSLRAEMLSVLHVGFHKNVTDRLVLGARAKIYMSPFNATSTKNSGYIYTVPAKTVYEQAISSDMQLNTSISEYIAEGYE
jgi:hypothetical protein